MFNITKKWRAALKGNSVNLHVTSGIQTLTNLEFSVILTFSKPVHVIIFHKILICASQITTGVEHLFVCLVTIVVSSFVKFLLKLFYILKLGFFLIDLQEFLLYILNTGLLSVVSVANPKKLLACGLFFHPLYDVFWKKFLMWSIFTLVHCLKKSSLTPR